MFQNLFAHESIETNTRNIKTSNQHNKLNRSLKFSHAIIGSTNALPKMIKFGKAVNAEP